MTVAARLGTDERSRSERMLRRGCLGRARERACHAHQRQYDWSHVDCDSRIVLSTIDLGESESRTQRTATTDSRRRRNGHRQIDRRLSAGQWLRVQFEVELVRIDAPVAGSRRRAELINDIEMGRNPAPVFSDSSQ